MDDRDVEIGQKVRRANPGELQELRRVVGAAREDHLTPGPDLAGGATTPAFRITHTDGTLSLQDQSGRMGMGDDAKVPPLHRGLQECGRGADPAALADRTLGVTHALLRGAVIVRVARDAVLHRTLDEGIAKGVAPRDIADLHRAVTPAERVIAAQTPLHPPEIGQHVRIAPAAIAALGPVVEIHPLPAIVDMAVDRRGAAQRLSPRREDPAPRRALARLHVVAPVDTPVAEGLDEACGDVDERVPVTRTGFQNGDGGAWVLGQPACQDRARRARAHDHIVKFVHGLR